MACRPSENESAISQKKGVTAPALVLENDPATNSVLHESLKILSTAIVESFRLSFH
jgi:hypothetical protein